MKKIISLLVYFALFSSVTAQVPDKMSYQAVVRNSNNQLLTDKNVGIKISIVSGTITGQVVYSERHIAKSNSNGLVTLEIGGGNTISGNFSNINWNTGIYFVRTEVDPSGGFNYSISGETQLLAVPYAFYAAKSDSDFSGNYNDLTNKPNLFSGNYNDLTNKPNLFSGNYYDLTNRQKVVEYTGSAGTGDILYRNGQNWDLLKPGTNGQTLRLYNGVPSWGEPGFLLPIVVTLPVYEIINTSAISGGNIVNRGFTEVTQSGICWSTSQNPTTSGNKTTNGSSSGGSFENNITGLSANTKYYVRAYATNGAGTAYGNQVSFNTAPAAVVFATTTTNPVINITENAAVSGGNITSSGGADIIARGICWSINQNPTIADSKTVDGDGTGYYYSQMSGLQGGTKYYVRSYATNSAGTGYGDLLSFSTSKILPVVTTKPISDLSPISANTGGVITHNGGGTISDKGICWNDSPNPTLDNFKTSAGTGQSSFISNASVLRPNTTYYLRAYVKNEIGTSYGNEISFTTPDAYYEGFETGFSGTNSGWSIVNSGAIEGASCIKTSEINSTLTLTKNSANNGQIYFYSKVELHDYMAFSFYVDNVKVGEYNQDYWGLQTYPIIAGNHSYKWVLTNDHSSNYYAWIDCIVITK